MPKHERPYRVAVDGPVPADLDERCAAVWRDIWLAAQHAVVAPVKQSKGQGTGSTLAQEVRDVTTIAPPLQ